MVNCFFFFKFTTLGIEDVHSDVYGVEQRMFNVIGNFLKLDVIMMATISLHILYERRVIDWIYTSELI